MPGQKAASCSETLASRACDVVFGSLEVRYTAAFGGIEKSQVFGLVVSCGYIYIYMQICISRHLKACAAGPRPPSGSTSSSHTAGRLKDRSCHVFSLTQRLKLVPNSAREDDGRSYPCSFQCGWLHALICWLILVPLTMQPGLFRALKLPLLRLVCYLDFIPVTLTTSHFHAGDQPLGIWAPRRT